MSKQFQFKLVLLGMCCALHIINKSLMCIQANLRLENLGDPVIVCIGARPLTISQVWFYVL